MSWHGTSKLWPSSMAKRRNFTTLQGLRGTKRHIMAAVPTWRVARLLVGALVLLGAAACSDDDPAPKCATANQVYSAGATFAAGDGCNTCTCNADGSITCTEEVCVACEHEGQGYALGESWAAGDGCNLCMCLGEDDVSCSMATCP